MKLFDKKRIIIIVASVFIGLAFGAYILYEQAGHLGLTEIIALLLTALIAATIIVLMIKKGNKE